MPEKDDYPEQLRQRLQRQRKRARIVLATFGLTFVATLAVFFLMAQGIGRSAANRLIYATAGPAETLWIAEQQLPLTGQGTGATFRVVEVAGENLTGGQTYEGSLLGVARETDKTLAATTSSRLLRFKRTADGWEQTSATTLGLNDSAASPVVASYEGLLWLFYMRANELVTRPADEPDAATATLLKLTATGARVQATATRSAVWLSVRDPRNNELHVLAVQPRRTAPAADKPVTPQQVEAKVLRSSKVTGAVARSSLAVIGEEAATAIPVVALVRKDEGNRTWTMMAWVAGDKPEGEWCEAAAPPQGTPSFGQETATFVTLMGRGTTLLAWFSDRGEVKTARADWKGPDDVAWSDSAVVPLSEPANEAVSIAWAGALFVLALALMGQGIWLVLNRERPQDRTLSTLLQRTGAAPKTSKAENKLVYAAGPVRAFALFIDLVLTCPIVILLQSLYSYKLEEAYGFIVLINLEPLGSSILQTVAASLVTLSVLVMYSLFCEMMWGRTLGKALFRLRVVDLEGESPSPWRLVVRNLLKIVEMAHWTVVLIPLALMLFSGRNQRLGDLAGGTVVIVDVVPEESPDDIDI